MGDAMRSRIETPYFLGRKQVIIEFTQSGANVSLKGQHGPGTLILWEQVIRMVYPGAIKVTQPTEKEKYD